MTPSNGKTPEPAFVLDLDELIQPMGRFKLGGKWYDYPHWDSFSLLEQATHKHLFDRIQRIGSAPLIAPPAIEGETPDTTTVTLEAAEQYARDIRELVCMISTMKEEAAAAQSPEWLWQAIQGFFTRRNGDIQRVTLQIQGKALAARVAESIEKSTMVSTSLASPASTKRATTRRSG